jgi:hypothetical protein
MQTQASLGNIFNNKNLADIAGLLFTRPVDTAENEYKKEETVKII